MKKINIVTVWTWFCNVLDTQNLSASEQLIMLHLIKIFNRNFWKPAHISIAAICRSCGKDARTVKTSITRLIKSKLLLQSDEEGIFLNLAVESPDEPTTSKKSPSSKSSKTFSNKPITSNNTKPTLGMIEKSLIEDIINESLTPISIKTLAGLSKEMQDLISEQVKKIKEENPTSFVH